MDVYLNKVPLLQGSTSSICSLPTSTRSETPEINANIPKLTLPSFDASPLS